MARLQGQLRQPVTVIDPWRDDPIEDPETQPDLDNDQESHVSPSDNDGETVPADEVVDEVSPSTVL